VYKRQAIYYGPYNINITFSGDGPYPEDAFAGAGANTGVTTGAVNISESQVTLNWSTWGQAQNGLWLQVDDNSDFSSPFLNTGAVGLADKSLSISKPSSDTFYWRVGIRASNYYYWTPWVYGSPALITPPDDTWINYDPTFQALVYDPDGGNKRVYFDISGYIGASWGNWVAPVNISSWGPVSIPDGVYSWRAKEYNESNVSWGYIGYWTLKKDTTPPSTSLDQPNGAINQTSFTVILTESDALSGVSTGDVDVRINGGSWQDYSNTTSDFTYSGSFGNTYEFRYQVQDNAGNWSGFAYDGSVYITDSPNTPTLIVPSDNTWINYNPTFQAQISDPDGDNVSADFNISGYGDGLGNEVSSGSISSWGPVSIPDGTYSWRARAYDEYGVYGDYSGYWTLKKDTTPPSTSLDQPNGAINQTSFTVILTESDNLSGVSTGDVDVRINGGSWQNYSNTTSDFTYDGSFGNTYEFRYRVQDNAGNLSGFAYDGSVYINRPPEAISLSDIPPVNYCGGNTPNNIFLNWTFNDPDGGSQEFYQIEVTKVSDTTTATGSKVNSSATLIPVFTVNSDLASLGYGSNFIWYDPSEQGYTWRVKVWDSNGGESSWSSSDSFDTTKHQWPSVNFTCSPQEPSQEEDVLFADQSTVYGGATKSSWSWTIPNANYISGNSSSQNPTVQFTAIGDQLVTLGVRDSDGFYCQSSKTIGVQIKLPGWKEILPW